jgi:hypothetical protein
MKIKKKYFIILGVVVYIFLDFRDLPQIMDKYPESLKKGFQDFSLIRFYNTYQTLSVGQYKIDTGRATSRNCSPLNLNLPEDEHFIKLISDASYLARKQHNPNALYREETTFTYIGAECTSQAKLVHLEYKKNEAHATFSCEQGDLVEEFTYSSTDDKCAVMQYKKSWGVKPMKTLDFTKSLKVM